MRWTKENMQLQKAELMPDERVAVAVDTSKVVEAERILHIASRAGATVAKMGLELQSATSWKECGSLAFHYGIDWIADAKIDDISNTTAGVVRNLVSQKYPPIGITIHTNSGRESMRIAEEIAQDHGVLMLGVTHLTSIDDVETRQTYSFLRNTLVRRRLDRAVEAGIGGLVCSGRELSKVVQKNADFANMFSMIPGTRSLGADVHDQKNVITPYQAIVDGADLLVIGRQVTGAEDPIGAYDAIVGEIALGIRAREAA